MIFIDGSNLYHILKNLYNDSELSNKLDFKKFVIDISKGKKLVRTYYYNGILDQKNNPEKYGNQQRFFEKLKNIPDFEVVVCRMQKGKQNGKIIYSVKEDDINIAVDMLKLAYSNAYDTAILVSSDGDFVPAIKAVKEIGKRVENIGFSNKFSWHLKNTCDRCHILRKEDIDRCLIRR